MEPNTSPERAHIEYDVLAQALSIIMVDEDRVLTWDGPRPQSVRVPDAEAAPDSARLVLPERFGRVLYEALAEFYGHTGHDMRALRQDYDAERRRVDKMIDALITTP